MLETRFSTEHEIESDVGKVVWSLISLVFSLIHIILKGLLIKIIWNWFMPSLFNLPVLTLPIALATSLVVGLFVTNIGYERYKDMGKTVTTEGYLKSILFPFVSFGVYLLMGFFLKGIIF